MAPTILWFRRNLRLDDNAALQKALAIGQPILPVYIVDDLDLGGASRWWLHYSLQSLDGAISDRGGKLILATGDPARELERLAGEAGAETIVAARRLVEAGWIDPGERVVLFNTGTGLKYPDVPGLRVR
jgi:deoxyribodipyrimidine photo-lyase